MENIDLYAPVIIPTLNRFEHLKRCLDSLARCTHADKTEVIISLDFPPSKKYETGYNSICEYLDNISGFREITIIKQDKNLGAVENINFLIDFVSKKSDRFIFTEDDNEFSPNFLDYIDKGLTLYKDNENVYAICGYNYPFNMSEYNHSIYFTHEMPAWGYGTWVKKNLAVTKQTRSPLYMRNLFKSTPLSFFFRDNMRFMNLANYFGLGYVGDVTITSFLNINNIYTVLPKDSLVRNWGHDGSGVNCDKMTRNEETVFTCQKIDTNLYFHFDNIPVGLNKDLYKKYLKFRKVSWKSQLKTFFSFFLVRLYSIIS